MIMRELQITSVVDETPSIRRIAMAADDGGALPGYAAGAHVTIAIPDVGVRKYSLINVSSEAGATATPRTYTLGIRLDPHSAGGSRFMHSLKSGDRLQVSEPANDFPLKPRASAPVLIGGGIGITPLITMAAELAASERPFKLLYAARSRTELAFLDDVVRLAGPACEVHLDDAAGRVLDLEARFTALPTGTPVYMCGPKPMLKAGVQASRKLGWPPGQLMFELFYLSLIHI